MSPRFVILGASGDLTSRFLMPALASLAEQRLLPIADRILGISTSDWDTPHFRQHIAEKLESHAAEVDVDVRSALVERLDYRQADVTDPEVLSRVLLDDPQPFALYLALPPSVAGRVLEALARLTIPKGSRVVCEKPFGHDLASARELNALLRPLFPEQDVFRIDHFLGMQTVQNLLGLRFANRVFAATWNRDQIERIEITWDETVGLEGRANYYDRAGALRDMVQNHLLQLLCLVAMEPPASFAENDFRDRKVELLRAVRPFSVDDVSLRVVRGRYTAGRIGRRALPNYIDEPGVQADRNTETFVQATFFVDNPRWRDVPFVLRTGKALGVDRHEVAVWFRPVAEPVFAGPRATPNCLRLRLEPDRMDLSVNINGPGDPFVLETIHLAAHLATQELPAYARLLLDLFEGDTALSIRSDEAEVCWQIVEPILHAWSAGVSPLRDYAAGSEGPEVSSQALG